MKTLLILILAIALAAAAFFTRPSLADFKEFTELRMKKDVSDKGLIQQVLIDSQVSAYIEQCTFKDRYLWVDVVKDNQTIYTGAFDHWFDRRPVATTTAK